MPVSNKTDIMDIYGLKPWIDFTNSLDDFNRRRHLLSAVGTLLMNCLKKDELDMAIKSLVMELKMVPKFKDVKV